MKKTAPHYMLFTEAKSSSHPNGFGNRWRFVLEEIGTSNRFEEADEEPGFHGERLQLLAVVRGLEALEQPSRVTLITPSKHVGRGIRSSLTLWRENNWHWERFGAMTLINDHDLWQRIDHAMQIHQINCRIWQFDPPHVRTQAPQESDQADLVRTKSRHVSSMTPVDSGKRKDFSGRQFGSFRPDGETATLSAPIRSEKLTLRKSRKNIDTTLDQFSRISKVLEEKIKTIGEGKAYGYAVN